MKNWYSCTKFSVILVLNLLVIYSKFAQKTIGKFHIFFLSFKKQKSKTWVLHRIQFCVEPMF